ncbi:shikimate kinase [Galdieria sulphuraria]|uniref:shikimate kinase n=1 Tax=Galdieria sulphuraria TaxID=130081 RepID=M2XC69_GALSU|nr:shikimate kinase [Galdieria sulphuraria]EME27507.1 shikimate kinase [Galdieria sulphuraria]|eukprot:XP_005704027.1 shikimate kinase [Galdieria sulphuraria]
MTVGHYQKQLECGFVPWTNPFSGCFCVKTSLLRLPPKYVFFKTGRRLRSTWSFYKDNSCSCCASGQPDVLVELNQRLRKRPIYLVGMMGSGKSTIGQCLASKLSYSFLDTDQVIEQVEQKKITQIFEQDGEDKFREVESNILNQIQPCLGYVVATGGGIVLRSSNWSILRVSDRFLCWFLFISR